MARFQGVASTMNLMVNKASKMLDEANAMLELNMGSTADPIRNVPASGHPLQIGSNLAGIHLIAYAVLDGVLN